MLALIPRPIRDFFSGLSYIESGNKDEAEEAAEEMIKSAFRIVITASAVFFVIKSRSSASAAAALGACLSLPCTLIASSGWLFYYGKTAAVTALTTGNFKSAGLAIASFVAGCCALEFHDRWMPNRTASEAFCEVGAFEWFLISPAAESLKESFVSWFKP